MVKFIGIRCCVTVLLLMINATTSTTVNVDDKGGVDEQEEGNPYVSLLQVASSSTKFKEVTGGVADLQELENLPVLPDIAIDDNDFDGEPDEVEFLAEAIETTSGGVIDDINGLKDDIKGLGNDFQNLFKKMAAALGGSAPSGPSPSPSPASSSQRRRRRGSSPKPSPRPSPKPSPSGGGGGGGGAKPITVQKSKCDGYSVQSPFCDAQNPGPIYSSPEAGMKDWESWFLDGHNKLRCLHGMPPMKWNKALAQKAQDWASDMGPRYQRGQNPHSSHNYRKNVAGHWMVGENIAWQSRWSGYAAAELKATYAWYAEIKDTNQGLVQGRGIMGSPMIGHYTQLVWKSSTDLGCGENKKGQGEGFYVCMYGAAGNMDGQVPANVVKIKVDPQKCQDPRAWAASGGTKYTSLLTSNVTW